MIEHEIFQRIPAGKFLEVTVTVFIKDGETLAKALLIQDWGSLEVYPFLELPGLLNPIRLKATRIQ
jgi:hypothetical protein